MTAKGKTSSKITQLEVYNKVRRTWDINPRTQVVYNKRKSRKKLKEELKKEEY